MNSTMKVLIVDDEDDIRLVAQVGLTAAGMEVLTAPNGPEGLRIAREQQPAVVVLDVMMPDMDGYATLDALREHPATASIPVIFLTAKPLSRDDERWKRLGVVDVIAKPFAPRALAERVRAIMDSAST